MSATRYAQTAERYWKTYLPSRVAQMKDPRAFFQSLGKQIADLVQAAAAGVPQTEDFVANKQARVGAVKAAEEMALADLVFLTPEKGTENRRLLGSPPLPGWEDDEQVTATA